MTISDAILDKCERSFIAAQEKVSKASRFYADTGLMAILCQHNRVLWVANLTSPREQQHFAFALIKCLFSELPQDWSVGLLYDIAFQIERSMQKHGILSDYHMCLMFAVSVFHVYGHQ
ncbi:hypothetical protein K439DRAFT_1650062 [Ramaria rubella]|nr:hypothetical protein K439DRAFT_1650062 [Ramaria rubella]